MVSVKTICPGPASPPTRPRIPSLRARRVLEPNRQQALEFALDFRADIIAVHVERGRSLRIPAHGLGTLLESTLRRRRLEPPSSPACRPALSVSVTCSHMFNTRTFELRRENL